MITVAVEVPAEVLAACGGDERAAAISVALLRLAGPEGSTWAPMRQVAESLGVSRRTAYLWLSRAMAMGLWHRYRRSKVPSVYRPGPALRRCSSAIASELAR